MRGASPRTPRVPLPRKRSGVPGQAERARGLARAVETAAHLAAKKAEAILLPFLLPPWRLAA